MPPHPDICISWQCMAVAIAVAVAAAIAVAAGTAADAAVSAHCICQPALHERCQCCSAAQPLT